MGLALRTTVPGLRRENLRVILSAWWSLRDPTDRDLPQLRLGPLLTHQGIQIGQEFLLCIKWGPSTKHTIRSSHLGAQRHNIGQASHQSFVPVLQQNVPVPSSPQKVNKL